IANGAADFGDDDVHVVGNQLLDGVLDLVGHVRDDLYGLAQILALAFLLNDRLINAARGKVAFTCERSMGEAFIVAEVEIGFGAGVKDVDFAVRIRTHGAGIDVDVRVELLQADAQAALFEEHADRGTGQAFAQRADDAAGDEDMFGHDEPPCQATYDLALAGKPQSLEDWRDREAA